MKLLTKEEEAAHWNATVGGGITGGVLGTLVGTAGIILAQRRYPTFRGLTLPFRAFLAVSTGTFASIIAADRASRGYEAANMPERNMHLNAQEQLRAQIEEAKPFSERAKDWGNENRYSIVFASWVASMGVSFALVHRNPYLTGAQKLVQARVYAQGLTLAVLLTSLAMEGNDARNKVGRWETVKVLDPRDPEHKRMIERRVHHERYPGEDQWMDMVAQEERKMEARKEQAKTIAKDGKTSQKAS